MKIYDRNGQEIVCNQGQNDLLKLLYGNVLGRSVLKVLTLPFISQLGGMVMDSGLSKRVISSFVESNHIDMSQYEDREFQSYNDFFTRKILEGKRSIDKEDNHLIAPCDSKVSYYKIDDHLKLKIKDTVYSLNDLLKDEELVKKYERGDCLIFRLAVDDYHRYHFFDDGVMMAYKKIDGIFHTVNPLANDYYPIYKENTRAYSLMRTKNFGDVIYMEVGAMMVGRIVNHHVQSFLRGEEKGYFEFGGSTVVLLFEKGKIIVDDDIIEHSLNHDEVKVQLGEKIGVKLEKVC
jgi:Phosphatidylserine decarboxylase